METRKGHAPSYKDLEVYKLTKELAKEIFEITKTFPKEEKFSLIDQIRRSSRSVGAQIAEAWSKRRYINHFISKLTDADSELYETRHWLDIALECNYIEGKANKELIQKCSSIGKMLNSMMNKADSFCKKVH